MCIKDSFIKQKTPYEIGQRHTLWRLRVYMCCLLYTSDAADARSSADLGGRRTIKKKHTHTHTCLCLVPHSLR